LLPHFGQVFRQTLGGSACPVAEAVNDLRSGPRIAHGPGRPGGLSTLDNWDARRARQRSAAAIEGRADHSAAACMARHPCARWNAGPGDARPVPCSAARSRRLRRPLIGLSKTCRRPAVDLTLRRCSGREVKYRCHQRFHTRQLALRHISRIRGERAGAAHSGRRLTSRVARVPPTCPASGPWWG
jgi:hypothetical protein